MSCAPLVVELTWTEVRVSALAGIDRNIRTIYEGRRRGGGQRIEDGWTDHVSGAIAECAVAKALGLYPMRSARDVDGDVGTYQVRSTVRHSNLIVRPYDHDGDVFILVLGAPPRLRLVGWLRGWEAKRDEYRRDGERGLAYFVPSDELHPMNELPQEDEL